MKRSVWLLCSVLYAFSFHALANGDQPHWEYEGQAGAENWGNLSQEFASCKLSKEQSPINIEVAKTIKANLPVLDVKYKPGAAEIINNGHTVQVNLMEGGSIRLGKEKYNLVQFHFHTPSEERINGKDYPLVAHFVHQNDEGKLVYVAVLMKEGKENLALQKVFAALPEKEGGKMRAALLNTVKILPADRDYYGYWGSLTTPPCSDGVRWLVLQHPVEISKTQIEAFRKLYKMNARPVQALNGRVVEAN